MNGAMNAPDAPSTWTGTSSPVRSCRSSSAAQISATGSYAPSNVEPRIATTPIVFSSQSFDRLLGREGEAVALHRHEPHLDVPVVGELLPADLDVDAHDEVRLVGRLALGRAPLLPAPLEREPAEHRRLARAGRRAAGRLLGVGRVPEPAEHVDAAHLELRGLRVLVLVDHVLVEALGHQLLGLRLHPRRHERREVHARVAVEHQLVVDDLVRDVRGHVVGGHLVPRDAAASLELEDRQDRQVARLRRSGSFGCVSVIGGSFVVWVTAGSRAARRSASSEAGERRGSRSSGADQEAERSERGEHVRAGEVDRASGRRNDVRRDRRDAERDAAGEVDGGDPPVARPARRAATTA